MYWRAPLAEKEEAGILLNQPIVMNWKLDALAGFRV
jgi:hypothetical protein